jgi:hypothetical protein
MNIIRIFIAFFFLLLLPSTLLAEGITQKQGEAILEELKAIKKELREIKQNGLSQKPKPNFGKIESANHPNRVHRL